MAHTCSDCAFGYAYAQDMSKRLCKGAPPTPLLMPVQGGVQLQFHWPLLGVNEPACALHKTKIQIIDVTNGKVVDAHILNEVQK